MMPHYQDFKRILDSAVKQREREPSEDEHAYAFTTLRKCLGHRQNRIHGRIYFAQECYTEAGLSLFVIIRFFLDVSGRSRMND